MNIRVHLIDQWQYIHPVPMNIRVHLIDQWQYIHPVPMNIRVHLIDQWQYIHPVPMNIRVHLIDQWHYIHPVPMNIRVHLIDQWHYIHPVPMNIRVHLIDQWHYIHPVPMNIRVHLIDQWQYIHPVPMNIRVHLIDQWHYIHPVPMNIRVHLINQWLNQLPSGLRKAWYWPAREPNPNYRCDPVSTPRPPQTHTRGSRRLCDNDLRRDLTRSRRPFRGRGFLGRPLGRFLGPRGRVYTIYGTSCALKYNINDIVLIKWTKLWGPATVIGNSKNGILVKFVKEDFCENLSTELRTEIHCVL